MLKPKVSILMSVYNGARHLREAIDSVLNQTYKDFEFIIIDDKSEDETSEIIKSYQDDRIIFIQNDFNIGLTKSLNKALALAKGQYIARIDHDDIYFNNKLQRQIEFFDNNPDCKILFTDVLKIDEDGDILPSYNRVKTSEDIFYLMHFINPVIHPAVIIEKTVLTNIGGYNEEYKFAQDYELWSRLIYKYKFYKLNEPLLKYRTSKKQISQNSLEEQKKYAEKVFIKMMEKIGIENIDENILYFHKYAYEFNDKISIKHLSVFKEISTKIINNTPKNLLPQKVKSIYRKHNIYYWLIYFSQIKFLRPIITILKKII